MKTTDTTTRWLAGTAVAATFAIFISDLFTPLGVADGINYIAVVLLTIWMQGKHYPLVAACSGVTFTLLGYFLSPPEENFYIVLYNRSFSIVGIMFAAFIIIKYKNKEKIVKKQKQELENLATELKASNSDLEQFAYVASHDLQEPLRKIQSFGERIQDLEKEKLSPTGKDYFERLMNASWRMQVLINDLLSYSRLSTRNEPFVKTDLNVLVKEVLNDMEVAIEKNQAKITLSALPVIEADKTQMRQLFQNLVSNAIKFRKENIPPEIRIHSHPVENGTGRKFKEIRVEDNGIGFDEKYTQKIFQFFQRLEGKKYEGTGIGLAVCRKILLRHGGTISVQSREGAGTTFIILLPATHST